MHVSRALIARTRRNDTGSALGVVFRMKVPKIHSGALTPISFSSSISNCSFSVDNESVGCERISRDMGKSRAAISLVGILGAGRIGMVYSPLQITPRSRGDTAGVTLINEIREENSSMFSS